MPGLTVDPNTALAALARIPHAKCQTAIPRYWRVDDVRHVDGRSVAWLYCWAKTGLNSVAAAEEAQRVFDEILDVTYAEVDGRILHEWAQAARYSPTAVDSDLDRMLCRDRPRI